ncbi:galactosylceramide sulfotransferase [Strongylocentrotus purpuratus]|uniref:Galactosylceramide sulfotransferase n=1 Tax=Strongylocentrotus purpuratus TaxID=7668 RepID=A0A7M7GGR0_STRPU|nr:galactosylceramide sulfotransferase [Strongylocentrotus purpuratus]XP_003725983.2 galactosylceramide sulfotransferase [Strongylocentrotus purpuratus]
MKEMHFRKRRIILFVLLLAVSIAVTTLSYTTLRISNEDVIKHHQPMNLPRVRSSSSQVTESSSALIPHCEAHKHVAYIKTHKTGSTTLETIFNRFGFIYNSSFIFNRNDFFGHFEAMDFRDAATEKHFLPPLGVGKGDYARYKNYDTCAIHVRFYRDTFIKYMANDTLYVSSVRDPADQWESAFNQFGFRKAISRLADANKKMIAIGDYLKVPFNDANSTLDAINEFLRKPEVYHNALNGEDWHFAHNDQVFDLATDLEMKQLKNETLVNRTIDRLVDELDMVIVNEYFDESLLVMKKALCWDFNDILYISQNKRAVKDTMPEETRAKIRAWNHADTLLHYRFNETLWKKIKAYGPKFQIDLEHFRQMLSDIKSKCSDISKPVDHGYNSVVLQTRAKANSTSLCKMVAGGFADTFRRVFNRQKDSGFAF